MKNCSFFLVAYITFVFLSTAAVLCWTTFDVTELNACPPQDSKFLTLVERSLEQCVEECTRRKSCAVVGYKRVLRLCELHMHSSMPVVSDNHCIRIMRDDIHGPKQDSCGEWQVFETTAGVEHCTVKECKPQPPLRYGQFLGNKNEVGSKKAVKCNHGYIEENNTKSVECLKEGIWSHNVSCVLKDCGKVPNIENGIVSPDTPGNTTFGSTATVNCHTGYETNTSSISCLGTGRWSAPVCSPKDCGAVSNISNGTVTLDITDQTTYQSTASVNCSVGYETVNKTITCLATGTWSASECVISYAGKANFWTNGNCFSETCNFTDGESMPTAQQTFWHTDRPNRNNRRCVRVQNREGIYRWNDRICSEEYHYICEY
ncbi:sushi, von Willebrand factor type A, EGF and pentraxin domain-containing protein 1-like isoform X2 [Mercenaria mercenaria]|uniref:sushi, von Willebrand factor type A, EGF and pentraxin domain-containing protein 1-like isoform X2 n=1 Tax=Mercenaria mercenaria TaxID=6596 RepID=UPI00234F73CC|nr:sushi, von Willebrand factor type A, EGF and pentraxin domain-containing protein 1-like isoform X2 [Mercenaria mercenaria]